MKVFARQCPGYSAQTVENIWEASRLPETPSDPGVRPVGVCFSAGPESLSLARHYALQIRKLGAVTYHAEMMSSDQWREIHQLLTKGSIETHSIGYILHGVDLLSHETQELLSDLVGRRNQPEWFLTAEFPMRIIPELREQFVVYLGLNAEDQMQFLIQNHTLYVDRDDDC